MAGRTMSEAMRVGKPRDLAFFVLALLVAVLIGVLRATPAHAATFTVNSPADPGADGCDATECTLREAINAANANDNAPTVDVIDFAIPGPGPHTISPTSSGLPEIVEPLNINGYSQPGASANTLAVGNDAVLRIELSGAAAPTNTSGLEIEATRSTVKGLVINDWENGVFLDTVATDNQVMGNFIGTDVSGTLDRGNNTGVVALGDDNTIGGTAAAARNLISGNGSGVQIGSDTGGNQVMGNYIGTNAAGDASLGNTNGVVIDGAPSNTVGGTTAGARNVISGNSTFGIRIGFGATLNEVRGNYIGTSAAGDTALGNGNDGVSIQGDSDDNTIGGTTAAAGNVISGNGSDGVEVRFISGVDASPATGNRILSNSIHDNDALGIDLVHSNDPAGVTLNDEGDPDGGPNLLQNFPVITSARTSRRATTVVGSLNGTPSTKFTLQFFSNLQADPSGFGEGQRFKAQKSVTSDDAGDGTFSFKLRRGKKIPAGQFVTATATDPQGNTSEFSEAVQVVSP